MAGRYPMAEDLAAFWENLSAGRECLSEIPEDRWEARRFHDPSGLDPRKSVSCRGGFLIDVDKFDPLFFQISPQEAAAIDPQERLFLQTAWETLEDAGYTRARLCDAADGKVGVFVGASNADYLRIGSEDWADGGLGLASTAFWSIANRVSYFFDFRGPSLAVDTACSSALTALHMACEALRSGECGAALAGGVNLNLHPRAQVGLSRVGMLSRTGRARAFAADADGMVQGEGVGAVLLKRLDDAVRDGDRIHGLIRATAINASGRTAGYLMPNPEGQAALIVECLARAGVTPGSISYIEAQAVGSPIGDPVEIAGLAKAFGEAAAAEPCGIGSLKPNIGHLEAASGIAQLTKLLLQLRHRRLAPSINADPPNPNIAFAGTPFHVQRTAAPWLARHDQSTGEALVRRAAVSSFGAGGANAHAIVEEYVTPIAPLAPPPGSGQLHVFPLSARNSDRLRTLARRLGDHLAGRGRDQRLADIAWTLQIGREAMDHRLAIVARDCEELRAAVNHYLADRPGGWSAGVRMPNGAASDAVVDAAATPAHLAARWAEGHTVAWLEHWPGGAASIADLPTYPFERRRCWIETTKRAEAAPTALKLPHTRRRAVLIAGPGDVADLRVAELPLAPPGPGELQIAVEACALNFADLLCLRGLYPNQPPYPLTPGFEVAGRIVAVGPAAEGFAPGDAVIALTAGGGGHADLVNVPAALAIAKPPGVTFGEACAYPIGFLTARYALERAGLATGDRILIQGAAGATGLFAIQLALERGAEVIGTTGSAEKLDRLRAIGVAHAIDHRSEDAAARVRAITGGKGVDVVLNTLSDDAIQKGIDLLAPGGRYVEIALTALKTARALDLSRFTENQSFISVNLGSLLARPEVSRQALAVMAESLAMGRIRPSIGASFRFAEIRDAYRCIAERRNFGKVVVTVGDSAPAVADAEIAAPVYAAPSSVTPSAPELIRATLARILCATLKITRAELDAAADFESCGLNSILGVAIMREVQIALGVPVPVIALWERPSLDQLAAYVADLSGGGAVSAAAVPQIVARRVGRADDPIIAVQTGGARPASYWVHGAPGEISWVVKLAQALGPDYPVFGFEARGLDGQQAPLTSVRGMARHYATALLRRDPEGPYRLGGYSAGGAIAFELAQQLIARGKRVSRLVLLDANAPGSRSLLRMHEAYDEGFIDLLAGNWFGELWGASIPLEGSELAGRSAEARLDAVVTHLFQHARPMAGRDELRRHLAALRRIGEVTGKALGKYRAKPLAGDTQTVLVRCRQGMSGADNRYRLPAFLAEGDYRAGWEALCPPPIRIIEVDCDHFTLMTEPHCSAVATALRALDEVAVPGNGSARHHDRAAIWDSIFSALVEEVRNVLPALTADTITPERSLTELGANSLDRVEIATCAMEKLDVEVPPEELAKVRNLGDLTDALCDRITAIRNGHG
jgi:NADPH:quinone reductase-like Zn-dependent oxidoreductase/3-oxoacyl-(acyl-carrier-protein) synthase/thioesterase domain-containing protein/acyl carrier protein